MNLTNVDSESHSAVQEVGEFLKGKGFLVTRDDGNNYHLAKGVIVIHMTYSHNELYSFRCSFNAGGSHSFLPMDCVFDHLYPGMANSVMERQVVKNAEQCTKQILMENFDDFCDFLTSTSKEGKNIQTYRTEFLGRIKDVFGAAAYESAVTHSNYARGRFKP